MACIWTLGGANGETVAKGVVTDAEQARRAASQAAWRAALHSEAYVSTVGAWKDSRAVYTLSGGRELIGTVETT